MNSAEVSFINSFFFAAVLVCWTLAMMFFGAAGACEDAKGSRNYASTCFKSLLGTVAFGALWGIFTLLVHHIL